MFPVMHNPKFRLSQTPTFSDYSSISAFLWIRLDSKCSVGCETTYSVLTHSVLASTGTWTSKGQSNKHLSCATGYLLSMKLNRTNMSSHVTITITTYSLKGSCYCLFEPCRPAELNCILPLIIYYI